VSNIATISATGLAQEAPAKIRTLILTAGVDAASVVLKDSADGSSIRWTAPVVNAGIGLTVSVDFAGLHAARGVYAVITGTSPQVGIVWE